MLDGVAQLQQVTSFKQLPTQHLPADVHVSICILEGLPLSPTKFICRAIAKPQAT